jgi:predicted nucleic acid-binding protein
VVAKFFLDEADSDKARALLQQSINDLVTLKCPYLVLYELTNTFIIQGMGLTDIHSCLAKLQGFVDNDVIILELPTNALLKKTAELASADTRGQGYISSYDAAFHALALQESIVLLTADKKHVRKTKSLLGSVEELSEFSISEPE